MRFTRLRLNGFKSFVDPTDLVIHEGLTGVVGPNGCGKSNLLEALRWVMGENRPSAMRGDGMEDVIFNGAATRGARHYAEVALVLDNSERLAPQGFNDADQIEVIRRITRDAGSAYRLNGKDLRARDVQMLFADASTGAHSPALVRQGQISELIGAKPKARRRILEEAAGISGLYQRRHEAELRLSAAEQNLTRVDDVLEALAQQISTLTRQAKQAARYREIGDELRRAEGMLLYRRWREAEIARASADGALRLRLTESARAETAARAATAAREVAEAALPGLREEQAIAGAVLQRLFTAREQLAAEEARLRARIDTLRARGAELERDADREAGLGRDAAGVIERLDWELAQLARAMEGQDARLAEAAEAARAAGADLAEQEQRLGQATEDMARLSARHQSAQRLLSDSQLSLTRTETALGAAQRSAAEAEAQLAGGGARLAAAGEAARQAGDDARVAEAALQTAEEARAEAQSREADARAARSSAEGEAHALRAEMAALTRLVEREAATGSQLLDRLQVEPGFEAALGAALSDDLRAPQIEPSRRSGWVPLPPYGAGTAPLPPGARPLAEVVTAPPVLARRLGQIGLVDASLGADLQAALGPGQRLVSREGDLWRWDGFRAGAEDAPSAAALRLVQLNRLTRLKGDLSQAEARAMGARQAHEALQARMAEAAAADARAREARRAADAALTEAARALARAEADRALAEGRLETARLSVGRHEQERDIARQSLRAAEAQMADLPELDGQKAGLESARSAAEAARGTMMALRAAHEETRREGEARRRRQQEATQELSGWKHRQETAEKRLAELEGRRAETEAELARTLTAPQEIVAQRAALADQIDVAEARRRAADEALGQAEGAARGAAAAEREAERAASESREARARAEALTEAARAAAGAARERVYEETSADPETLLSTLKVDPDRMPDAETLETEVQRLKRQREALGAVNLRAEEDMATVNAEYDALVREKLDLEEAIRKLRGGIAGLNREGRERLLTAFEQVNTSFAALFTHLFGGGEARLVLVESDDPLEAGLEIMCQPPGKRLSTLSLLSGGEQTLTALALIFAVFLANPAPICVLDEVDAPLDDANVGRFCDLADEMTRRTNTRFLIITHHAVTMARMDRLYGVTMAEPGVSQLVSVDLKRAEALVA
ncbi:MAG: chromosome segregation protein SMC [Paracoccaceae bacterium]